MKRKIWREVILLLLTLSSTCLEAQDQTYRKINNFYKNLTLERGDVLIPFIQPETISLSSGKKLLQIILVRHGTPVFNKKGWYTFYEARAMLGAYDTVSVYPLDHMPVNMGSADIDHIYSSPLPRTRSTAIQLSGDSIEIRYDSLFIEFRNEIIPIPWIRLPYRFWNVTSRLLWMAGLHSDQVPSLPYEKERAKRGAGKLHEIASREGRLVLVAHGYLNRYLIRFLKKKGWSHSYDGGFHYANVQVMSKIIE